MIWEDHEQIGSLFLPDHGSSRAPGFAVPKWLMGSVRQTRLRPKWRVGRICGPEQRVGRIAGWSRGWQGIWGPEWLMRSRGCRRRPRQRLIGRDGAGGGGGVF